VTPDDLYEQAASEYGRALERLVCAYETDADRRNDLLQEIHIALWRSFSRFEGRCSIRTWVYRIAHNAAASYISGLRRVNSGMLVGLEHLESFPDASDHPGRSDDRMDADRLLKLIHRLKPLDRQLMLLYLEDLDAASIGEIVGISENNVRVQIHRIKKILRDRFHGGGE
jgi:RNA polymerase sigma-70 factor, ECF subfamily